MGAFDDLIPAQRRAPSGGGGGAFDDLIPDTPDPSREASLGERFMVNMGQGFEGTLAGQATENVQNPANTQQAAANTIAEVLGRMAETGAANAPATLPNPAQGGTPSPEGPDYLGVGGPAAMPERGTGDYAGQSREALAAEWFRRMQAAEQAQDEYSAERAPVLERREQMPGWYEEDGLLGKGLAGAAALAGQLTGGAPSPENLLAFGRGANVLGRAGRGAAGGAAGAGVAEPVVQEQELRRGERDEASLGEGAFNVALGGLLGGVLNVTPDMARGVRRLIAGRKGKPEAEVTAEDLQEFDPEELMATAQAASEGRALDPEALDAAIRSGTGTDAEPRLGEGMAPQDARRARRERERELGAAFQDTDVLRRQDVEPGEEGLEVREDAEPLRDPTGEQANPESYGARSLAARTARDLGVTLDEQGVRLAARDIQADPQADPAAIVRSYSQEEVGGAFDRADIQRRRGEEYARDREGRIADFEAQPEQVQQRIRREYAARGIDPDQVANAFTRAARQGEMREVGDLREEQAAESRREFSRPAFELAERRRQRREDDLATGERVDDQASTYRAAEEPYERQAQREVTLLGARRNRRGQLVGGEAVEVLARAQRQTPNGGVQDMARIVRGDNDPEWVPADQLETVTTPENPRMFVEALGQTREPPRGVARERGDSPEGFDASQTPEPRRAVDRQADPDGLRRGLFQEGPEVEPEPTPGDGPAAAETFDGRTGRPYREADTTEVSPQGEARTEFQGEGGEMPITRTRRPVREERSYDVRMREPDPEGDLNLDSARRMDDDELGAMFGQAEAQSRPETVQADTADPRARRVQEVREAEDALRAARDAHEAAEGPDEFTATLRAQHEARDALRAAQRQEFEDDTGIIRDPTDDQPLASDQRSGGLGGKANEWFAEWIGREDLIHLPGESGLRGIRQTQRNLIDAGYLSPNGHVSVETLDAMPAGERQRLLDAMQRMQDRVAEREASGANAHTNRLGSPARDILRVIDTWQASRGTTGRPETAQADTPRQAVNRNAPEDLADPEVARTLRESKQEFGWAERGGNLLRDQQGQPKGRTRWIPYNAELMDAVKGQRLTRDGYAKLVDRALDPEARPLTNRQRNILEGVIEAIDPRARERAEAEAEADRDAAFGRPDQEPDDFDLEGQTEASRRAEEQQTRERADQERRQRLNEERRAQADRDADDFTLTGSDRPADEAAARGQMDLTDQPAQSRDSSTQSDTDDMAQATAFGTRALSPGETAYVARKLGMENVQRGDRRKILERARAEGLLTEDNRLDVANLSREQRRILSREVADLDTERGQWASLAGEVGQALRNAEAAQRRSGMRDVNADRPSGGGTQLYSGIPLDRIAAAVKNAWAGERKGARETAERTGMLIESTKEALGGSRAKNRATKRSPLMDLWRVTLATLDGDLRTLAGKFSSPTLKSLPDMFHATAGRGDGVKQTFDEAVQARNNPRLQEVDRFMSRLRDANLSSADKQQQIIRLIENAKAARRGEAGKVAADIEKFLKQELEYLRKAGVELGEVRDGYFPREMDGGKARANADGFIRAATRAYKEMGLRDADAKASAEAYWESTVYGASGKPGTKRNPGQTPSFVQSRVFTKAAAKHLDAYRVRDIDAVLSQYVMRATRRAEIARRFGDNWKDWADIEAKIRQEDPDAQEVLPLVRDRVALSAGVNLHSLGSAAQHSLSMARTWTTLATLPKAAMSSIGELVIAPWRGTTGNVPGDMGQHLVNIWAHMGNISRTMTGLGRSEQLQASFEMAEDIGIIAGTGHNSLMAARFAGGDPVGRVQSEVLAQFFRRNLLEGLTNYTRVTSMVQGQTFLRRVAKQMERHPNRSGVYLRELGVPRGEEAAFARFVRDLGDDLPTAAAVTGRYAGVYRNALQRFTDQTVMRPSQSTRPKYASHPLGAVIFQLQAFGYAFQKNVLNRQARLLASKDLSYADKLAYSLSAATSAALLVGLQGLMRDTRDRLYDPDIRERKTPMAHLEGAVSQAGLLGVADPYLQSLTGIRYQRNPLASLMGPAASGLAESTFTATSLLLNNSENTNTAERNLADSTYDWLVEPAMQAALTPVSTGTPIFGKAATALTVYGIPKGRDTFTDALAGPRSDRRKPPIQGTLEWMLGGPAELPKGRGAGRDGGRGSGRSGGRDGGR